MPNEPPAGGRAPYRILQSIGAAMAGVLVNVVLSIATDGAMFALGIFPAGKRLDDWLFVIPTIYRFAYGVLGSYVTARLAPYRPLTHAMVLGFIGMAAGTAGLVANWGRMEELGPLWYALAIMIIPLPCAWLGGVFGSSQGPPQARS